jgi:hypothetical protein
MSLLDRRVRGVRLIDLAAMGVLAAMILGVYLAKTFAGRERAEIASVSRQIDAEQMRIRLLKAEVSHLEQPARIERLSETYLGLKPVAITHDATLDELTGVLRVQAQAEAAKQAKALAQAQARVMPTAPVAAEFAAPAIQAATPTEPKAALIQVAHRSGGVTGAME